MSLKQQRRPLPFLLFESIFNVQPLWQLTQHRLCLAANVLRNAQKQNIEKADADKIQQTFVFTRGDQLILYILCSVNTVDFIKKMFKFQVFFRYFYYYIYFPGPTINCTPLHRMPIYSIQYYICLHYLHQPFTVTVCNHQQSQFSLWS